MGSRSAARARRAATWPKCWAFTLRWANASNSGSHRYNDWKEFRIPAGKTWDFWCNTGYHAQIKFDCSFDEGYQEKIARAILRGVKSYIAKNPPLRAPPTLAAIP